MISPSLLSVLVVWISLLSAASAAHARNKNVFGHALDHCSSKGMALTGITGSSHCVHFDALHHYDTSKIICIDVPSFSKALDGSNSSSEDKDDASVESSVGKANFFSVTGGPELDHLPCTEDATKTCPVKNWCINEMAFASYVDYVGGCDKVGRILCEATNEEAIAEYELKILESQGTEDDEETEKAIAALECLRFKCWIK